jgi:HlyD family secretion protein
MKKKTIYLIVLAVLVIAGFIAWRFYRQNKQASDTSQYQTTAAERGSLVATIGATGTVRANQTAILAWQTSGSVELVVVSLGEAVTKDQQLAQLAQTSLPQAVILAQADLVSAQKALDDLATNAEIAKTNAMRDIATYAQAVRDAQYQLDNYSVPTNQAHLETMEAVDQMSSRLEAARQAFEPYKYYPLDDSTRENLKDLLDEAQSDYNAAVRRLEYEYELEVAQNNLEKARQDYQTWKDGPSSSDVAAAQARIDAAQATINLARLNAPFPGSITSVDIKPGDQVSPGSLAFRLDDLNHLLVDLLVSEVDINRISNGQEVLLTFDAILDQEYHGIVNQVAQAGTSEQGVVDFKVTVELTDADEAVKPGMTAAVNIIVNQLDDVLLVPNRAVRLLEGKRVVYILKDGSPQAVEITLGASSDTDSQVLSGDLKPGDLIVLNPPAVFEQNGPPPWVQ